MEQQKGLSRVLTIAMITLLCLTLPVHAVTYTYDNLNRLTSVTYKTGQKIAYTYDSGGNILSVTASTSEPVPLSEGKIYAKSLAPSTQYPDANDSESTDGILAGNYPDGKSYGYKIASGDTLTVTVTVDLEQVMNVNSIKIHKWEGTNKYEADSYAISTSTDGINYQPVNSSLIVTANPS